MRICDNIAETNVGFFPTADEHLNQSMVDKQYKTNIWQVQKSILNYFGNMVEKAFLFSEKTVHWNCAKIMLSFAFLTLTLARGIAICNIIENSQWQMLYALG